MLNLEQTPLFLRSSTHAILWTRTSRASSPVRCVVARLIPLAAAGCDAVHEFSTQGYWFAVNPLWANVFWKIGFGVALTAAALGTTEGLKLQFATYIGMVLIKVPIILPIFLALKRAPYKIVATKPKAKADQSRGVTPARERNAFTRSHSHRSRTPALTPHARLGEQPRERTEMYTPNSKFVEVHRAVVRQVRLLKIAFACSPPTTASPSALCTTRRSSVNCGIFNKPVRPTSKWAYS